MSGVMCQRVTTFVLCGLLASSLIAAEPKGKIVPRETSKLVGDWQLAGASYQMAGSEVWQFSAGGTLTTQRQYLGGKSAVVRPPVKVIRTEHRYEVDTSRTPHRLTTFVVDDRGAKKVVEKYAFEFRDSKLWICRDRGEEIKPGTIDFDGGHDWTMNFTPLEKADE